MDDLLRAIYQERASDEKTLGIIKVARDDEARTITDDFNTILLVIVKDNELPWFVKHYQYGNKTAALHVVKIDLLREWIDNSGYRKVIQWLTLGQILFDRNEFVSDLKHELDAFPQLKREHKCAIEYAKAIRSFKEAQQLLKNDQLLDSFNKVVRTLHCIGRLSIIEQGFYPEMVVWEQIKRIDPSIFKLYQELIESQEPLKDKLQLMMLAIDFSLSGKSNIGTAHLKRVLLSKQGPWIFSELNNHPDLKMYQLDLGLFINFLIDKGRVESVGMESKTPTISHRGYQLKSIE